MLQVVGWIRSTCTWSSGVLPVSSESKHRTSWNHSSGRLECENTIRLCLCHLTSSLCHSILLPSSLFSHTPTCLHRSGSDIHEHDTQKKPKCVCVCFVFFFLQKNRQNGDSKYMFSLLSTLWWPHVNSWSLSEPVRILYSSANTTYTHGPLLDCSTFLQCFWLLAVMNMSQKLLAYFQFTV